ncbi:MAG: PIN domain-containing protein [Propionibacteriaceae bacterium]|jgi:predicted nucleic acid-binding protein|nr:PIN domain-containing protein [Propionibacteriaceae bacterium]
MILLDTSVLISPMSDLDPIQEYAASILSRAELEFGLAVSHGNQASIRRQRLRDLDGLFSWLPFTELTTRAYGVLARALHTHAPAQARRIDTYIAAHALELGVPLLTGNPKDFQHLAHLVEVLPHTPE